MERVLQTAVLAAAMVLVLVVGRAVFGAICRWEGYRLNEETVKRDNPALGIRYGLFLFAIILSFAGVVEPSKADLWLELGAIARYSLAVIIALVVSRYINDHLILYGFDNNREVIQNRNTAVATVEGATYLATAFVISGSITGLSDDATLAVLWFLIGQALLIILSLIYRRVIPGIFEALANRNQACAFSFSGLLVSSGMALGVAVSGQSHGWLNDASAVASYLGGWLVFMVVAHVIADRIMLPAARLREEVMKEGNLVAGIIEGVVFVSITLLYGYLAG
ncbi:MAG: DUF350 domain-containing protein [Dehalococcoidia bacterium]|nr:DUF350 domain-containing protein [Dehalococcoidia bacterium]